MNWFGLFKNPSSYKEWNYEELRLRVCVDFWIELIIVAQVKKKVSKKMKTEGLFFCTFFSLVGKMTA
jgi:hypothetical protein